MLGLRDLLAPPPQAVTLRRIAQAAVAAVTATAAVPIVRALNLSAELGDGLHTKLALVATTSALSVVVAGRALASRSDLRARVWLALGGALAGTVAMWTSYRAVLMMQWIVQGWTRPKIDLGLQLGGSFVIGGLVGFLFGTAFVPVILVTRRAIGSPTHDGRDRVALAAGATLVVVAAVRRLASSGPELDLMAWGAGATGALAMVLAGARMVARVRIVVRAREGAVPGFHVVPRTGAEDEKGLVPLVRASRRPSGVLAATGVSAPYRGARGVMKLGLAPLGPERFGWPVAGVLGELAAEGANGIITLALAVVAVAMVSPLLLVVVAVARL
jgi:hypothetical protein